MGRAGRFALTDASEAAHLMSMSPGRQELEHAVKQVTRSDRCRVGAPLDTRFQSLTSGPCY